MKTTLLILAAALTLFASGCKSPQSARATSSLITATATIVAFQETPEVRPYIKAATPVICDAAHGTNPVPAVVIGALEQVPGKNVPAALLINSVLAWWITADAENNPDKTAIFLGVCDGLTAAQAASSTRGLSSPRGAMLYPRVHGR